MIGIDVERDREMKKWETIGLDRVIQMTREKAEWWRREGEETGGDGLPCPPSLPCSQGQWDTFPICLLKMRDPCGDRCPPLGNFLRVWRCHFLSSPHLCAPIYLKYRKKREGMLFWNKSDCTQFFSLWSCTHQQKAKTSSKWIKVLRCAVTCFTILLSPLSLFF